MLDGTSCWGRGVEAAAWMRGWLESVHQSDDPVSMITAESIVHAGIEKLPEIACDIVEFGWSFSMVVTMEDDRNIHIGWSGGFAAVAVSRTLTYKLFAASTLADSLIAERHDEADVAKYSKILCDPPFGTAGDNKLSWTTPIAKLPGVQIVIGDLALPKFLASRQGEEFPADPETLRDEVQAFAGRSSPTAIIRTC